MLHVYNSLTRQKDLFKPHNKNKVSMYVCGPTVYDFIHMGNARSFTAFDTIVRYLKFSGYEVNYVRNITDIDDKIIKRALVNNESFSVVTERFTQAFRDDMKALGLLSPTHEPRATEFVSEIVALIEQLIAAKKAYIAENGDVYYEVRQFESYGCLSHRNIDELESGARVEVSEVKRDPLDFVLWKMAKPDEPSWDSPWGKGRPGWHIECSAMSMKLLGESFDLHGGGRDLIFPHHENEIAQSEGVTQQPFVKYWLHAGYLQMDQEKMSKSLGNFFTLRDVLKNHSAEVLRFFFLSSHYRSPLSYSEEALVRSRQSLERLYNACRDFPHDNIKPSLENDFAKRFIVAMDDDFNTPIACSVLFDLAHYIQKTRETNSEEALQSVALLRHLAGVLGFLQQDVEQFLQGQVVSDEAERIEALIAARDAARANKDWALADRIRNQLIEENIVLEDGEGGTRWKRGG
ncbi:MAG: cysteine--tRNA ligase [Gammaproteobacteria bacterium]|nr:cysteine--tRNA ligase [Gammaproteobacteria bacterium]